MMRNRLSLILGIGLGWALAHPAFAQDRACCLGDGICLDTNQAGCDASSGEFLDEGSTCATTECMGACCQFFADTCTFGSRDACDGSGGREVFQGPNTTCELNCSAKLPTRFTYQGQLKQAGVPLTGTADLECSLWSAGIGGNQVGAGLYLENVAVVDGLFSVPLDFGARAFNGAVRWIEIAVRSPHDATDMAPLTTLTPRQVIGATPYALQTRGLFVNDEGNVGIGTGVPNYPLHVANGSSAAFAVAIFGQATSWAEGKTYGVRGESSADEGRGVYGISLRGAAGFGGKFDAKRTGTGVAGFALSETAVNIGVHGKTFSPEGFAGYFEGGKNYFEGSVGIGTETPFFKLTVEATDVSAIIGKTTFDGGVGVWGAGSADTGLNYGVFGQTNSPDGYAGYFIGGRNYFEGNVGFGTETPLYPLHAETSTGNTIFGKTTGSFGIGVTGRSESTTGTGVYGEATATSGGSFGVYGRSSGATGRGVYGLADNGSGTNVGVFGQTASSNGYAGFFMGGRNYFSGNVGIGVIEPLYRLHVETSGSRAISANTDNANGYAAYFTGGRNYFEGFVGIGTDDPQFPIHVNTSSDIGIGIKSETSGFFAIEGVSTNQFGTGVQGIADSAGVRGVSRASTGTGVHGLAEHSTGTNYGVRGETDSADGFAGYFEGGRNYFEGRVGIGTEFPQAKLQIDSAADEDAFRVRVGGGTKFVIKSNGRTAVGANSTPSFQLQIFGEGTAGKPGGGSWSISSDRRLKKNIRDLSGSLDKLLKLRSVTFEYKDPESINEIAGTQLGMIAQEVEKVFPDWVSTAGHGYKTLTFRGFEALTVNALRELRTEKDDQIEALRKENEAMQVRLAKLERLLSPNKEKTQ